MKDLTTGSLARHLLETTGFMLVTMLFQTLYFLVDLYWVGRLGASAVAAVTVAGNLMYVALALTQMLAVGTTTLVAHAAGRKDHDDARLVFHQSQGLAILLAVAFTLIVMALRFAYARGLAADPATAGMAVDYLTWFIPALGLQFGMVAMSSALRGTGLFKPGMIVQTATVVLNMLLAPLLIFGWGPFPELGVAGAAIATLLSVGFGVIWLATFFLKPDAYLRFTGPGWSPQPAVWGRIVRIGLPAAGEFALMALYLFIVTAVIQRFGAAAQAGFGIGLRVIQAGFMPVVALGFAVAPVAGQNFSARRPERVIETFRIAATLAASAMLVFVVICHLAPAAMMRAFSSDPTVVAFGEEYLRIISWTFMASGVIFVASSLFQALGNTLPALIASAARLVILAVPTLLLARHPAFHLRWVWYLSVASIGLQLVLSLWLLRREMRLKLAGTAVS